MNILIKTNKVYLLSLFLLAIGLPTACSGPPAQPTSPDVPAAPPEVATVPSDNSSTEIQEQPPSLVDRVDVVYFHRPQRCPTCLCFEERIRYVVSTYFQNDLDSGKMTFGVYNIGDSKNVALVNKYGAVSSQLFINTVKDGTGNIEDIQDIWSWSCRTNKAGFDQQVKNVIEQSLEGEN
jgi:hypothetical protein